MTHKPHRVIITGTGRAGTTFLVALLTELGVNTGWKPGEWKPILDQHPAFAGLERADLNTTAYVVKQPESYCQHLKLYLQHWHIDHVFVLVRDLEEAAQSRQLNGLLCGGATCASQQVDVFKHNLGTLFATMVLENIPFTTLRFPECVQDWKYVFNKVQWLMPDPARPDRQSDTALRQAPEQGIQQGIQHGAATPTDATFGERALEAAMEHARRRDAETAEWQQHRLQPHGSPQQANQQAQFREAFIRVGAVFRANKQQRKDRAAERTT